MTGELVAHGDFETRAVIDLKKSGVERYVQCPHFDALTLSFKIKNHQTGEVVARGRWQRGQSLTILAPLFAHVKAGGKFIAHSAHFELNVWNELHRRDPENWPALKVEQTDCTMARAHALALPGGLDQAAKALGLEISKDAEGRKLMMKMCRPRKAKKGEDPNKIYWIEDEASLNRLGEYCDNDVEVEDRLYDLLPPLTPADRELWILDWYINQRGVLLDVPVIRAAQAVIEYEGARLSAAIDDLTNGAVPSARNVEKLKQWIKEQSAEVHINDMGEAEVRYTVHPTALRKEDVKALLRKPPSELAKEVLLIRQSAAKASTAKLKAMLHAACNDGRARGLFQFHATLTSRWGGRRIQTQNMPRPPKHFKMVDVENVVTWLRMVELPPDGQPLTERQCKIIAGVASAIRFEYGSVMDAISWSLRGMIIAAPGKKLVQCDYSNIESRKLPWLAGEQWKLDAFREVDAGIGPDVYCLTYANMFHVPVETVTEDSPERQIGKVYDLASGFGGGVAAVEAMGQTYGLHVVYDRADAPPDAQHVITYQQAEDGKKAWRKAHPNICKLWYGAHNAVVAAIQGREHVDEQGRTIPSIVTQAGKHLRFRMIGDFLAMRLPSGKCLYYPYPRVEYTGDNPYTGEPQYDIFVRQMNGYTHQWGEQRVWGGVFVANATSASATGTGGVLGLALPRLERAGYFLVMHVHDEALAEVPTEFGSWEEMATVMCEPQPCFPGLPIVSKGWEGNRYRK